MAGVITTGNHPKALWPGVKAWWGLQYSEHGTEYTDLFSMDTSTQAFEEDVLTTGFGLAPVKDQSAGVSFDSHSQGYTTRYINVTYGLGYIVTSEEIDDNKYPAVSKGRARANAFSMRQTKENVAANVYNRAVTAGYTGGDGQVLLSTAHPTKAGDQSNTLSTAADISEAAIEDMVIQIMGALNDKGLKISLMPKSIHVHRSDFFEAHRILDSSLRASTGDNDANVLNAQNIIPGGIKVNHYFSDSDMWFIKTNCPDGMKGYQRRAISFTQDNDFNTDNAKAKSTERYVFGWTDWRGVYGSEGA